MPNRKPSNPSTHDKLVRQESDKLKQAGWKVQADIAGFDNGSNGYVWNLIPLVRIIEFLTSKLQKVAESSC